MPKLILYECGICNCYHPWEWDGDCREDKSRFETPDDYALLLGVSPSSVEVRSMEERVAAD